MSDRVSGLAAQNSALASGKRKLETDNEQLRAELEEALLDAKNADERAKKAAMDVSIDIVILGSILYRVSMSKIRLLKINAGTNNGVVWFGVVTVLTQQIVRCNQWLPINTTWLVVELLVDIFNGFEIITTAQSNKAKNSYQHLGLLSIRLAALFEN